MKILVTGGAGFIGSAVCRHVVASDGAVANVDKLTYAASIEALDAVAGHPRYALHQVDICDRPAVQSVLEREQPDAVLHLAAESHVDRSILEPAAFVTTNIVGTHSLLEAVRDYWEGLHGARQEAFRFVHVSTDEVFGSLDADGAFREETAYDPASPYAASKAGSDHLALAWHRTYGLPVLLANCCNNYGPYQFTEKLIPLVITNAILGRQLPVYGSGRNVRDWIYVDDHVRALIAVLERGQIGGRYNIGARAERSNLDVVKAICALLDERKPLSGSSYIEQIAFVADRPGHDFRYAVAPDKVEREIGWRPQEDFESGLAKTVDWYLTNEAWWQAIRARCYDGERLGLLSKGHAVPLETPAGL